MGNHITIDQTPSELKDILSKPDNYIRKCRLRKKIPDEVNMNVKAWHIDPNDVNVHKFGMKAVNLQHLLMKSSDIYLSEMVLVLVIHRCTNPQPPKYTKCPIELVNFFQNLEVFNEVSLDTLQYSSIDMSPINDVGLFPFPKSYYLI